MNACLNKIWPLSSNYLTCAWKICFDMHPKQAYISLALMVCLAFGFSCMNKVYARPSLGDTVVVEASSKTIKHKNRGRNIGRASFWENGYGRIFYPTPFAGPADYQIQKVSIPMRCDCSEIDSFEVTLFYTNLTSCETQTIYSNWHNLGGAKQLTIIPQQATTTDSNYLLSINLRPNCYPTNHLEDTRTRRYTCFYLKLGPVKSNLYYMFTDSTGLQSGYMPTHWEEWGFIPAPKMKLWLYR
jgi:hypothetical protein